MKRKTQRIQSVLDPVIPTVNDWISQFPGTLSLGQGIAYFTPPESIFESLGHLDPSSSINGYGSCLGSESLLGEISQKLKRDNSIQNENSVTMVTAGANMAFSHIVQAIGDIGEEIILPTPYYFNHHMAITMAGLLPVCVPTQLDYQLDISAIEHAITNKTKAIVTVSPNNPTGAVYSKEDLILINKLCENKGLYHISDEAYEYFTYDSNTHYSPASENESYHHTISIFSLSKSFGFAGWRVGYLVAPKHLEPALRKVQDTQLICPPAITQIAATEAMKVGRDYPESFIPQLTKARNQLTNILLNNQAKCRFSPTQGAFYILVEFETSKTSEQLAFDWIKKFKLATLPASTFGIHHRPTLRISFGALAPSRLEEATDKLSQCLASL